MERKLNKKKYACITLHSMSFLSCSSEKNDLAFIAVVKYLKKFLGEFDTRTHARTHKDIYIQRERERERAFKVDGRPKKIFYDNIGIKHVFSRIYICQVPRERSNAEVFKNSRRTRQILMHCKTILDCCYCINSTKYLLNSAKIMALYFVTA